MEPEFDICCTKKGKKCRCCIDLIVFVAAILLTFILGVLIGAVTGLYATLGLGAVIAIIVTLVLLLLVRIIMIICDKDGRKKC